MAPMDGKVALVTGGNAGLGQAAAMAFARNGAKVVLAARRVPEGEETVQMIAEQGGEAIFVRTDVALESEVEAMVSRTVKTYGRLDYAFNNAGAGDTGKPLQEIEEKDFRRIVQVDLVGVWLCMKYELRQMHRQGSGAIVNCSSVAGLSAGVTCAAYVSSKHGVVGLTRAAARENSKKGIRVNAVCPGIIGTPLVKDFLEKRPGALEKTLEAYPLGLGKPEQVAEAVIWLCSDASSFITGHPLPVEGGRLM